MVGARGEKGLRRRAPVVARELRQILQQHMHQPPAFERGAFEARARIRRRIASAAASAVAGLSGGAGLVSMRRRPQQESQGRSMAAAPALSSRSVGLGARAPCVRRRRIVSALSQKAGISSKPSPKAARIILFQAIAPGSRA